MRLINTSTGAFEEFIGQNIPKYAILSHTWGEEEVSYQDYLGGTCSHKKGYKKIRKTLELARERDVLYAWVDTCCIDKSSSAELTEAINSMFQWYQRSENCFVYLSDLEKGVDLETHLSKCRWFSRGWTLQELIAPGRSSTHFFDKKWNYVGSKRNLRSQLSRITGVNADVLSHKKTLSSICVAHKMSWAASRETTRIEDMAYCLLGIFDINMPLLYGEESKAFRRLQEEIIKRVPDLSIFAWKGELGSPNSRPTPSGIVSPDQRFKSKTENHCGIMALSPLSFKFARGYLAGRPHGFQREFSVCHIGVRTQSVLLCGIPTSNPIYILPLGSSTTTDTHLGVRLRKVGAWTYVRDSPFDLYEYNALLGTQIDGDNYVLVDEPHTTTLAARSTAVATQSPWTRFSLSSCRQHFLRINPLVRVDLLQDWGCLDSEDSVFFVPDGGRTDCAGFRLLVYPPRNSFGIDPNLTFDCVVYAFGWSQDLNYMQYTVLDFARWKTEIQVMESLLKYETSTQARLLQSLMELNLPKVPSIVLPITGSRHSVRIYLTFMFESRSLSVGCDILRAEDVVHEESERWTCYEWSDLGQVVSV